MVDIHREIIGGRSRAKMLLQVHDELVFEAPQTHIETESRLIREKMEHPLELKVPLVADISWGRTWAEAK